MFENETLMGKTKDESCIILRTIRFLFRTFQTRVNACFKHSEEKKGNQRNCGGEPKRPYLRLLFSGYKIENNS